MGGKLSNISWWRVILGGVGVIAATYATVMVIVTGYAFRLGFEMRGAPPQDMISAFAERIGPQAGPVATVLLTLVVAYWVARKVAGAEVVNALGVGIVAIALTMALTGNFSLRSLGVWVTILAASGVAGWLAARKTTSH